MTRLANRIEVVVNGEQSEVLIDGEPLPWYLAVGGVTVAPDSDRMPSITVEILAESVSVLNTWRPGSTDVTTVHNGLGEVVRSTVTFAKESPE